MLCWFVCVGDVYAAGGGGEGSGNKVKRKINEPDLIERVFVLFEHGLVFLREELQLGSCQAVDLFCTRGITTVGGRREGGGGGGGLV